MSHKISSIIAGFGKACTATMGPYRAAKTRALASEALSQTWKVDLAGQSLVFSCPSSRSLNDVGTLLSQEPETIAWLDILPKDGVLWDIGANVGAYSIYGAAIREMRVIAFEPSSASYATLARNIELNRLGGRVEAYCLALDDASRLSHLYMANTEAGHSMHAFDTDVNAHGKIDVKFAQSAVGISIDAFMTTFSPPPPQYIKIDVDGNEPRVLSGGRRTIMEHTRSIMIEVEVFTKDATDDPVYALLDEMGFVEEKDFHPQARRNALFHNKALK